MALPKLYIFEDVKHVFVSWEEPAPGIDCKCRWNKRTYYHPEVTIHISKSKALTKYNHDIVGHAALVALDAEGFNLAALERPKRGSHRSRRVDVPKGQMPLFPPE